MKKLYGLIGFPLGHSWSKAYFTEKFSKEGISDCVYELFPLHTVEDLRALLNHYPNLMGLNVTIPYKEKVIPLLDGLSAEASAIGAVNTIAVSRRESHIILKGFNTDAWGFRKSLDMHDAGLPGMALVLGSGGASRAVCHVLHQLGWKITLVSRHASKTAKASGTNHLGAMHHPAPDSKWINNFATYESLSGKDVMEHLLIVNTTPLGMHPNAETLPDLPYQWLTASHILYDLVYNPEITLFLEKGLAAGSRIIGGLDMLKLQADRAWQIWQEAILPGH